MQVAPEGPLIANSVELEIAAAVDGLGIICTFEDFLAGRTRRGRAASPCSTTGCSPSPGPFLYYQSRRHMPGPLRAFVDFLKREQRQ